MNTIQMQGLTLRLYSGEVISLDSLPPRAIALDGCVRGPQQGSDSRWSFDHHDNCLRLVTLATCEQVRAALCLGGAGWAQGREVAINDLDGDTILSTWLLLNPERANEDGVRTLVRAVAAIDAHGPAGALMLSAQENELSTLYYSSAIAAVTNLRGKIREEFARWDELLAACCTGISMLLKGQIASREVIATPFITMKSAEIAGYSIYMVTSEGWCWNALYQQGVDAGIVYKDAANGTRMYTIAKRSDLVELPVRALLDALNKREPGWGGSSSIGGSPRLEGGRGSSLLPSEVWELAMQVFAV